MKQRYAAQYCFCIVVNVLFTLASAFAQSNQGSVAGNVQDS